MTTEEEGYACAAVIVGAALAVPVKNLGESLRRLSRVMVDHMGIKVSPTIILEEHIKIPSD